MRMQRGQTVSSFPSPPFARLRIPTMWAAVVVLSVVPTFPIIALLSFYCFPLAGAILGLGAWISADADPGEMSGSRGTSRELLLRLFEVAILAIGVGILGTTVFDAALRMRGTDHVESIIYDIPLVASVFATAVLVSVIGLYESSRIVSTTLGVLIGSASSVLAYIEIAFGRSVASAEWPRYIWVVGLIAVLPLAFGFIMLRAQFMLRISTGRRRVVYLLACVGYCLGFVLLVCMPEWMR